MGGGRTGVRSNGRPTDSVATRMPSYFLPMKRLASYSSVPGMVAAVGRARSPTKASTALVPLHRRLHFNVFLAIPFFLFLT